MQYVPDKKMAERVASQTMAKDTCTLAPYACTSYLLKGDIDIESFIFQTMRLGHSILLSNKSWRCLPIPVLPTQTLTTGADCQAVLIQDIKREMDYDMIFVAELMLSYINKCMDSHPHHHPPIQVKYHPVVTGQPLLI